MVYTDIGSWGKEKDGSTGFKVPEKKDLDAILSTVENFGNNVFKVGSSSGSERSVVFFFILVVTVTNRCDGTRGHTCVGSNFPMPVV